MNQATQHRVIIIEDNPDMQIALKTYVEQDEHFFVAGVYNNCEDAITELTVTNPRIVLMDIDLPGMDGVKGTKIIKKQSPKCDIIIITVFENNTTVFAALKSGACGYLTKTFKKEELISSLYEVIDGGAPMSMKIAKMVVSSFNQNVNSPLTERETEILSALAKGKSYSNIAETLFISLDTVKFHIKNIYIKLQVKSKSDAIEIANRDKLI